MPIYPAGSAGNGQPAPPIRLLLRAARFLAPAGSKAKDFLPPRFVRRREIADELIHLSRGFQLKSIRTRPAQDVGRRSA